MAKPFKTPDTMNRGYEVYADGRYVCPTTEEVETLSKPLPADKELVVIGLRMTGSCGHEHAFRTNWGRTHWLVT